MKQERCGMSNKTTKRQKTGDFSEYLNDALKDKELAIEYLNEAANDPDFRVFLLALGRVVKANDIRA
jgi:hypothetical protein